MLSNCDINDEIMGKVYNKCVKSIEHLELSIGGICLNECGLPQPNIPEVELEENNTDYLREEVMKITTLSLPTTKNCLQTSK